MKLAAVACVLEKCQKRFIATESHPLIIFSDSAWVCNPLTVFLAVWDAYEFTSSDGAQLKYASLLQYIVKLAVQVSTLEQQHIIQKVQAHSNIGPYAEENHHADLLTKKRSL